MSIEERDQRLDEKLRLVSEKSQRLLYSALSAIIALMFLQFVVVVRLSASNNRYFSREVVTALSTKTALCALRAAQARSIVESEEFLKSNPRGIPGIPAKAIQQGIADSKQTLLSLSPLNCVPLKP